MNQGHVAKLVYAHDSKSCGSNPVWVRIPPCPPKKFLNTTGAYIVGVALGDGNLSNPNGRAVRLRITCDLKYPRLIKEIAQKLKILLPNNKVSSGRRNTGRCVDVSVYSNQLGFLLPWECGKGPKEAQAVGIPLWIRRNNIFLRTCLRGLFQTDGSLYHDRGYRMVNFTNVCRQLADDVFSSMLKLGYRPNVQVFKQENGKLKHTIRLTRGADEFIKEIDFWKA